ncbi:hypothetical protein EUGRSUZ_I01342 [Eucalyptus grandis]|uniref:Uncharacterized protein n=2 Tax=Eucalyptus grandis TaxID=71139 RepID=A0ACC3JFG6_EUCGR|nr:hypothetical protein EUGRSUZ_I01342 [Eucalyptus grandis]
MPRSQTFYVRKTIFFLVYVNCILVCHGPWTKDSSPIAVHEHPQRPEAHSLLDFMICEELESHHLLH